MQKNYLKETEVVKKESRGFLKKMGGGGLIVNISGFALDGIPTFMIPYKQLKERDCYEIYFNLWL
jgi:hypothetical protein